MQKYGEITKMTIITGSHGYKRDHTGSNGFTRVRTETQVHTRVHIGVHHSASLRAQRGSLPGPASLYYKNAMSVCPSVSQSVRNRIPVISGHPPKTPPIELKSNQNTRGGQGKAAKIYSGQNSFKKKSRKFL